MGLIGALWAVSGFSLILIFAIFRLTAIALDTINYPMHWYHWLALALSIIIMAYSEGYKGFQLKFSPRFAARCRHLRNNPALLHVLLAPFFCMGFFHTTRARQISAFVLSLMIIGLIQLAHHLPQPWRGILDTGVVVGLSWGLISLWYFVIRAFKSIDFDHSAELPDN